MADTLGRWATPAAVWTSPADFCSAPGPGPQAFLDHQTPSLSSEGGDPRQGTDGWTEAVGEASRQGPSIQTRGKEGACGGALGAASRGEADAWAGPWT